MHIPACETTELELIRFDRALEEADRPSPDYDAERWLYVPNIYSEYRYILGTRGEHPLICIGINPSTAAPDNLDNTLKSVERIALYNGFDSFLMFNVYAQRATNPDDMELTYNAQLHQENRLHIIYLAVSPNVQHLSLIHISERSKKGHPHHPLYLRRDSALEPFDAQSYITQLLSDQGAI